MNATKLFAFTLLTAVASAAFAGESDVSSGLQRAQVKADVVRAAQDGSLIRTGDAYSTPCGQYMYPVSSAPSLTRAEVQHQVTRARADGTLLAAGEAPSRAVLSVYDTPSTLARADVKAQVLQARLDGTLIPAGEADAFSGPRAIGGTSFVQARIGR